MPATNSYANDLINTTLGRSAGPNYSGNMWLALFTASPTNAGSYTNEVPGGSTNYARVRINTLFPAAASRQSANNAAIAFNVASASWGTISDFAFVNTSTIGQGVMVFQDALSATITVSTGQSITWDTNAFTLQMP